ncbi:AraC family transcriptional regulator [Crocinitomix catalasitica]|uniref:AraC family transcriptional regulator n=1 Tax=Crocinitomix catalasitica TaxID=184607 RepID=UPI0004828A59|nr:helix-turn-helix transcriptional regulator [Crocinitomix catalasitica]
MAILPVLRIDQFDNSTHNADVYANIFSDHIRTYHASITKPHKHDFYLVVLFTKGLGIHEIDFKSYNIQPGSLFILRPGQTHYWELSKDIEGYIFFHTESFYKSFFPNNTLSNYPIYYSNYNSQQINLSASDLKNYTIRFEQLYKEYKGEAWHKLNALSNQIESIYIDLSRLYIEQEKDKVHVLPKSMNYVRELEVLIEANYLTLKKPSQYANLLNISTKHLNKIVQNSLGKSSSELINNRIILEAQRLLTHGQINVKEIAYELGYEDPSYFTRFFKTNVGVSPTAFADNYTQD